MARPQTIPISIVVPLFNEAHGLRAFHDSLVAVLAPLKNYSFEIIYCDDGSRDGTLEVLQSLAGKDRRIKVLRLTRNFGKEVALTAGLRLASGDAVVTLDGDGQHPVQRIPDFLTAWQAGNLLVVGRYKAGAHSTWLRKAGARWYYRLLARLSGVPMAPRTTDYRLLDKAVYRQYNTLTEHNRLSRGLIDWLGYAPVYLDLSFQTRQHASGGYATHKLVKLALDSLVASSLRPLYFAAMSGALILPLSFLLGLVMVLNAWLGDPLHWHATGTAYVAVVLLFFVGLIMVSQGIIGLYLAHIYSETQNRPLYVIDYEASRGIAP